MLPGAEAGSSGRLPKRIGPLSPGTGAEAATGRGGEGGGGQGGGDDELGAAYEFFASEYGWSADYLEGHVTDEQFGFYLDAAATRKEQAAFIELDRIVVGTQWGVAIALDSSKGRKNFHRWDSVRRKAVRGAQREKGLTGAALEAAIMAMKAADSSLVKIEART